MPLVKQCFVWKQAGQALQKVVSHLDIDHVSLIFCMRFVDGYCNGLFSYRYFIDGHCNFVKCVAFSLFSGCAHAAYPLKKK